MISAQPNLCDLIAKHHGLSLPQVSQIARLWHCRHDTWEIARQTDIPENVVQKVLSGLREQRRRG